MSPITKVLDVPLRSFSVAMPHTARSPQILVRSVQPHKGSRRTGEQGSRGTEEEVDDFHHDLLHDLFDVLLLHDLLLVLLHDLLPHDLRR